ncbi:MAG: SDR family NAD(P)-dependent oxidoreductase [Chloroflexi bacterium]|jgi:NADP-dependent 3-hydroxy acid dehydrogenase YdfG|nr:SDR family NAD(P)-dependent oxidoreductase [Chloroflexota bacterium]
MNRLEGSRVLITGASAGIGKACAEAFAERGAHLALSARRLERVKALATGLREAHGVQVRTDRLDVTDRGAVRAYVEELEGDGFAVDVLVNNAGKARGKDKLHEGDVDDWEEMIDTNVKGLLYMSRAVLPHMVERDAGHVINIGSIGGIIGLPYQGLYSATKFALHGMTEALRMEIKALGLDIDVVLVAPGDIHTDFPANRQTTRATEQEGESAYAAHHRRVRAAFEADELNGAEPSHVAQIVGKIVRDPAPKARYLIGGFDEKLAVHLKPLLPARLFDWILMREYEMD